MIYFVSDIHLGVLPRNLDKEREDLFLTFLSVIKNSCSKLFIVGDFFDYWFEYKYVIPKEFYRTLAALSDMRPNCEIEYLMGNHDFGHLAGGFFETELGITVSRVDIARTLFDKRFYISHGDGKSYKDTGYKIIKAVTRNRPAQFLYNMLHPTIGIGLASRSSRASRNYTSAKDFGEADGMTDFAERKIREGYDYVIMGHRHRPVYENIGSGYYVNLGDWISRPTFGRFDGKEFELLFADSFINSKIERAGR